MKTKAHKLRDDIYLIELTDEKVKRLFVVGTDFDLSYELLSVLNDNKEFKIKDYIKAIDIDKIYDYLCEINDDADDYLYKDDIEDIFKGGEDNG